MERTPVGVVLGTHDASPLEFWVGVAEGQVLELDALVEVEVALPVGPDHPPTVVFHGLVDEVRKRFEGARFDSDAFRVAEALLPMDVSWVAHVQVTRITPEVFVPPHPGTPVYAVRGEEFARAMTFDRWAQRLPIGLTRTGEPVYANFEFVDGTRGAHVSISGVSGVATKTSYATFLLYGLFHQPDLLGPEVVNTRAVVFNVKGEDLLWLDQPNVRLDDGSPRAAEQRAAYAALGLPVGPFRNVGLYAPARKGAGDILAHVGERTDGRVQAYCWTLREFATRRLLRFAVSGADDPRAQLSMVVQRLEGWLEREVTAAGPPWIDLEGEALRSFSELAEFLCDGDRLERVCRGAASGTLDAFRRRLFGAVERIGHLVRGEEGAAGRKIQWNATNVTVIDIHALHATAQTFVVGVMLQDILEQKERGNAKPLVFVVLDELNKYAPRQGWSPIQEVLLDIAERGRSLGLCLFGAQQTASEVERRVVANAAIKVVGRLDIAESERPEYGFLGRVGRLRAGLIQPGTMLVSQPEIPVPLLVKFPFPAWATRKSEAPLAQSRTGKGSRYDD